jgi:hypothetical protein
MLAADNAVLAWHPLEQTQMTTQETSQMRKGRDWGALGRGLFTEVLTSFPETVDSVTLFVLRLLVICSYQGYPVVHRSSV